MCISDRGIVQIAFFDRGVTRHTCVGRQTGPMADHVIDAGVRAMAEHDRCIYMVDNWDGSMMATEFREKMTAFFSEHTPKVEAHMLFRSKMFEMGLNIANLVLGRTAAHAYSDIEAWQTVGRDKSGSSAFRRAPMDIPDDLRHKFKLRG